MEIKPIETHYAGCRFRSRLEARWAVVFDHLDIAWRYELQGYEIPGGGRYLPDFWLPTLGFWVEVKGRFREGEWDELLRAVDGGLPGDPDDEVGMSMPRLLLLGEIPSLGGGYAATHVLIVKQPDRVELRMCVLGRDIFWEFGHRLPVDQMNDPDSLLVDSYVPAIANDAYRAGRSARFEYGERG